MGIRAGGDPLTEVVPDLKQLVDDPRRYLADGPLLFGPRRYFGLAALFGLPGLAVLGLYAAEPAETERLAVGVALLIGAAIWLYYSLGSAGHSLFLGPDGVEVRYRDTAVFCPWDLFDVDGEVWVAAGMESPTAGVTVPVSPAAVDHVVWRRGVVELGRGLKIRAPQAWLLSARELVLPGRYELRSEDVGKLLLLLGTRLGGRIAVGQLREKGMDTVPDGPPPERDRDGFYTVSLTSFRLPPCCVACAGEPDRTVAVPVSGGGGTAARPGMAWVPTGPPVFVEVPICERCHAAEVAASQAALRRWMFPFAALGLVAGLFAPAEARGLAALLGLVGGALVGLFVGSLAGQPRPIDLRGYHAPTGTMRVRFRNPAVEQRYREWRVRQ